MDRQKLRQLAALIEELVAGELGGTPLGPWRDKRDALLAETDEPGRMAVEEFASWFEQEGER